LIMNMRRVLIVFDTSSSHMTCKDSNCECWTLSANNFGCFDRFFLILSFDL
jgi:hypothetical protein